MKSDNEELLRMITEAVALSKRRAWTSEGHSDFEHIMRTAQGIVVQQDLLNYDSHINILAGCIVSKELA